MKNTKFPISKLLIAATLFLATLSYQPLQAQITFDDDVDDEGPAAPIDGLLGLGLVAGVWYGIKKLKEKRN